MSEVKQLKNPLDKVPGIFLEAKSGPEVAVLHGWTDNQDDIPSNLTSLLNDVWLTAYGIGESVGQTDGVTFKRESLAEAVRRASGLVEKVDTLTAEHESLKSEHSEAVSLLVAMKEQAENNATTIKALTDAIMSYADVMAKDRVERESLQKSVASGKEAQTVLADLLNSVSNDKERLRDNHEKRPMRRLARGLYWLSDRIERSTDIGV